MGTRLNKYISDSGYCSRREADRFIEMGKVMVGRNVAQVGDKVTGREIVKVNGHKIDAKENYVYIALNKPAGITCTTDPSDPTNIVKFVNYPTRIFNIGRLDKDSEGLILLTDNGDIVNKILRAGNNHEKEYEITVDKSITPQFIEKMSNGVRILGTTTKKCEVIQEGDKSFRIILTQGLNRQIRRMCEALDYEVMKLRRTRIMNITIKKLPLEQWRFLTDEEMELIMSNIEESDGEENASRSTKPSGKRPTSNFHKNRNSSTSNSRERGNESPGSGFGKPTRKGKLITGGRFSTNESKPTDGRFSSDTNGDRPRGGRNTTGGRNSVDGNDSRPTMGSRKPTAGGRFSTSGSKPTDGRFSSDTNGDRPRGGRNTTGGRNSVGRNDSRPTMGSRKPTAGGRFSTSGSKPTDGRFSSDANGDRPRGGRDSVGERNSRSTDERKPATTGKFPTNRGKKPAGARFSPTSSSKPASRSGKGSSKKSTPNRGKRK